MRFVHGLVAIGLWALFMCYCHEKGGLDITNDMMIITSAIVAAGAMPGGR